MELKGCEQVIKHSRSVFSASNIKGGAMCVVCFFFQTFEGNINSEGVVRHELQHAVLARYIRFIPVDWSREGRIGVRLELYGCSYCESFHVCFAKNALEVSKTADG